MADDDAAHPVMRTFLNAILRVSHIHFGLIRRMAMTIIFPEEDGVWWPLRPSKPLAAGVPGRGRFDSSPFRFYPIFPSFIAKVLAPFPLSHNKYGCDA